MQTQKNLGKSTVGTDVMSSLLAYAFASMFYK